MEIRTCEEYVLRELENTQKELASIKADYLEQTAQFCDTLKDFQELKDIIKDIATVYKNDHLPWVIGFNSLYENWDNEKYKKLIDLVPGLKARDS